MKHGRMLLVPAAILALCCGSNNPNPSVPGDEVTETPADQFTEAPSQIETTEVAQPQDESTNDGSISRADLDRLLATGPAAILALVKMEPVFDRGRFVGFRISAFYDEPPTTVDLQVGDVVVAINSKSVERPEHFFAVIETLKKADNLEMVILRNKSRKELTYPIRN